MYLVYDRYVIHIYKNDILDIYICVCVKNVNIPVGGFLSPAIHPVHPDGLIEAGHRPVSESCGNYPSTGRPTNLEAWRYLLTHGR